MKKTTLWHFAAVLFVGCSCTTTHDGSHAQSAKSSSSLPMAVSPDARVQGAWQTRFEFAVREAGDNAEGWALFSDSSMGHTGQQLVVRHPDGSIKLCYSGPATNDCSFGPLDPERWQKLTSALSTGDTLSDRPVRGFDTLNVEYVHIKNMDDKTKVMSRVFFMVDDKPLPSDYSKLMDGFTTLNK